MLLTMRRCGLLSLAAGLAALAVSVSPGVSASAAGTILVQSAGNPSGQPNQLQVVLEASSAVTSGSIVATLTPVGQTTPEYQFSSFALTSGNNDGGSATTWTLTSSLSDAGLPLGRYTIEVAASDSGGDHVDDANAGSLAYVLQPNLSITLSPSSFSYGDEVTISGTDTGTYPDGSTAPVAGQMIQVSVFGDVATDAAGNYSVTVQAGIGTGQYLSGFVQATAEEDATADSAYSADISVPLVPDPTRISNLHVSSSQPAFGAPVTVSGVAQYLSHGTWLAYGEQGILISSDGHSIAACDPDAGQPCLTVTGSGTTAADGSFSAVIPGGAGNADYTVWPTGLLGSAFFTVVPASFTLHVRHVPLSASISVARGRLRGERVQMRVCIAQRAVDATPAVMARFPTARFEYRHGKGRWRWLPGASAVSGGGKPKFVGHCYQVTVKGAPGRISAEYRMVTVQSAAYLAATSRAVWLRK